MAYNRELYTTPGAALDAGIIYDQTEGKMQSEINAIFKTYEALYISVPTFSSFPKTVSNNKITADMRVVECLFGSPFSIKSSVAWSTANGSLTLSGTIDGSTTAELVLIKTNT